MGWNTLDVERSCPLLEGLGDADYAYFVHSYAVPLSEATVASCRYGARFSACVAWRNFLRRAIPSGALRRASARGCCGIFSASAASRRRSRHASDSRHRPAGRALRAASARATSRPRRATTAEPLELLARYRAYGADWLHVVDLDGARDGSGGNRAGHRGSSPREPGIELQVGGGLRNSRRSRTMLEPGRRARGGRQRRVDRAGRGRAAGSGISAASASPSPSTCGSMTAARPASPRTAGCANRRCSLWRAVAGFHRRRPRARALHRRGPRRRPRRARTWPSTRRRCGAIRSIAWQASGGVRDAARSAGPGRLRRGGGDQRQGAARGAHSRSRSCGPFLPNA